MHIIWRVSAVVIAVASLAGCNRYSYEISIVRRGESFERTVKITKTGGDVDPPPAGPGAEAVAPPRVGTTVTTVAGATPADVGGAGWIGSAATSMGTLVEYTERFRGTDDPAGKVVRLFESVDRLVDHLLEWLDSRMGDAPEYVRLRAFGQTELRRDLKNIAMALYLDDGSRPESTKSDDPFARAFQYLVERGYFKPDDLPAMARSAGEGTPDAGTNLVRVIGWPLLSKAGIDPRTVSPKAREFLDNPAKLKESFDLYLSSTRAYAELCEEADAAGKDKPDPEDVLRTELAEAPILIRLWSDQLRLVVAAPVRPLATNGTWDEAAKVIRWEAALGSREQAGEYPFVAHARWVEPDGAFQAAHFGSVILDGDRLAEYCVWRKGLTEAEGRAWDGLLGTIKPGGDARAALAAIKTGGTLDEPTADSGINLVCAGIESARAESAKNAPTR